MTESSTVVNNSRLYGRISALKKRGIYMSDTWYDGLPEEAMLTETDKIYMQALKTVKAGLGNGIGFDAAASSVEIKDEQLRQVVLDDVLKVIIAEEHFAKKVPLEQLAKKLQLAADRIEKARTEMLEDVEQSSVNAYYDNIKKGTEH